ncbi:MAG: tetratricopeptide repeat protein [Proteobacteria bacterium]|nr:tetratricopeptide repeat protein [Pseudomonadota bacterium]MDA1325270.1 tetratricopeptide repeat protein [Pseudomonadota bacterium]
MFKGICTGLLTLLLVNAAQATERGPEPALLKAGEKGIVAAQLLLGSQYLMGLQAPQDFKKAHNWYGKAANQGNPKAQTVLGLLHLGGTGVQADAARAATWFQLAALQGSGEAQLSLANLYAEGRGVAKDPIEAHMWYSIAIENLQSGESLTEAVHSRNVLAAKMTGEELQDAKIRTRGVSAFAVR